MGNVASSVSIQDPYSTKRANVIDSGDGSTNALVVNNPTTDAIISTMNDTLAIMRRMAKIMESLAVVDVNKRQKVTIDSITAGTVATGIAVAGASSLLATTNYPTNLAPIQQPGTSNWQPVWIGPVDQRYVIKDAARLAYNVGIRQNLSFT